MRLTGLHLLLTYQCTFECDHCFVWGSPWQPGTMTVDAIDEILRQAQDLGTVTEQPADNLHLVTGPGELIHPWGQSQNLPTRRGAPTHQGEVSPIFLLGTPYELGPNTC